MKKTIIVLAAAFSLSVLADGVRIVPRDGIVFSDIVTETNDTEVVVTTNVVDYSVGIHFTTNELDKTTVMQDVMAYSLGLTGSCALPKKLLETDAEFAASADSLLAGSKVLTYRPREMYALLPKTAEAYLAEIESAHPHFASGERDATITKRPYKTVAAMGYWHGDANLFRRTDAESVWFHLSVVRSALAASIRDHLKNDAGQVQAYMRELATVMDAPRFAGMDGFCAKLGVSVVPTLDYMPVGEDAEKFKHDVYYKYRPFDKDAEGVLRYVLGAEGYRKFVSDYDKAWGGHAVGSQAVERWLP